MLQTEAAKLIQKQYPDFKPKTAIILGSGLGGFVNQLQESHKIPYTELPGFPKVSVVGHTGQLVLGRIGKTQVVCLQGRSHSYEGNGFEPVRNYIRTLRALGCETLLATNAAGSLSVEIEPGSLMLITDHINLQAGNPLIGPNDDSIGPRFLPVDQAYDPEIRARIKQLAEKANIQLHQGVYICVSGPNYETAAEIRAYKILGADAVGMSTVPEVLVAHHCGMKVGAISVMTNYATGLAATSHDHKEVVAMANKAGERLGVLLRLFCES